jgi:hypothetical protein
MSERNSGALMGWPPIGPSLSPAGVNVRQEDGGIGIHVGVRVSDPSLQGRCGLLRVGKTEENSNPYPSLLLDRTPSPPLQEFRDRGRSVDTVFGCVELADPRRRTSVLSRSSKTPDAPPVLGAASSSYCPLLALPASKRRALTVDREDKLGTRFSTRQDRRDSLPRLEKLDYGLPKGFGERLTIERPATDPSLS